MSEDDLSKKLAAMPPGLGRFPVLIKGDPVLAAIVTLTTLTLVMYGVMK